jgi:hypothetical protein
MFVKGLRILQEINITIENYNGKQREQGNAGDKDKEHR